MICKILNIKGTWKEILNACRTTVNKDEIDKEPTSEWKRKLLLSEHSPIRKLTISAKWENLKSWISVHFIRHKIGIEHFVRSQRPERGGNLNRDEQPQGTLINHEIEANAQAIINISRKRLCSMAQVETREAWKEFLNQFKDKEPELYSACICECIYRGHCYELNSCGYYKTNEYIRELEKYRKGVNDG
jgi:hypothetical protein